MKRKPLTWALPAAYGVFVIVSLIVGFEGGRSVGKSFVLFAREMVIVIPAAFVLIGLFEVWVPRSVVERHLGTGSGLKAHLWSIILAGTAVGGLYVAFPVALALRHKGARLGVVFSYVGLAAICRMPMTLFEISFLGPEFTVIRYFVSVPLVILFSEILGRRLEKRGYTLTDPEEEPRTGSLTTRG